MGVDLAVATPVFLDYTFVGLEALPGRARSASRVTCCARPGAGRSPPSAPSGSASRGGIAAPLGRDLAGPVRAPGARRERGIASGEPRDIRTPHAVVMPVDGERAMVTVDPGGARPPRGRWRALEPRAVGVNLELLEGRARRARTPTSRAATTTRAPSRAGSRPRLHGARACSATGREALRPRRGRPRPSTTARELAEIDLHRRRDPRRGAAPSGSWKGATVEVGGEAAPPRDRRHGRRRPVRRRPTLDSTCSAPSRRRTCAGRTSTRPSPSASPTGVGGAVTRAELIEEGSRHRMPALPGAVVEA